MVQKVALGQDFLRVLTFSITTVIPPFFRRIRKIAKSDYYLHVRPSVRPPARIEQFGSQLLLLRTPTRNSRRV